jgi:hypothetical protein
MHTDTILSAGKKILIMDSAADMSMIGQGFEVFFHTG